MHYVPNNSDFDRLATKAGHENTEEHLRQEYRKMGIIHSVVMGNPGLGPVDYKYPDFMSYCISTNTPALLKSDIDQVEKHFRYKNCIGLKIYPGYHPQYLYESDYFPYYELAEHYEKTVAIHTGSTSYGSALLRFCHPLTLDETAVRFPHVQFVMCHLGHPHISDGIAILLKNQNVAADRLVCWKDCCQCLLS